jgi:hypothetical protein
MTEPETGHDHHIVVSDYFFGTTTNRRFEEMKAFFFSWCGCGTIAINISFWHNNNEIDADENPKKMSLRSQ